LAWELPRLPESISCPLMRQAGITVPRFERYWTKAEHGNMEILMTDAVIDQDPN
jgi:hypothetical protein